MVESYIGIGGEIFTEEVIQKSRFICTLAPVGGEDDAKEFIGRMRKRYSDATHNCYAFVASMDGNIAKYSDDGEPQGTAGLPMLEVLKKGGICMTAAVVTRYFGGVKLGTGGLARAYSGAVSGCLQSAAERKLLVKSRRSMRIMITLPYELYPVFLRFAEGTDLLILNTEYGENVAITCVLPLVSHARFCSALDDAMLGRAKCENLGEEFFAYN